MDVIRGRQLGFRPDYSVAEMDRGVLAGAVLCFGLVIFGAVFGGAAGNFVSPVSLLIVLGGTVGACLVHFSLYDIRHAWAALQQMLFTKNYHPLDRIRYLVRLSHAVRREGLLVLEREAEETDDSFLRNALQLTVDAQEGPDIKRMLETEIRTTNERAGRAVQVFETLGTYAPAMGLIGTLIGLIKMLGALEDPATVGPAMAVALVTTLYGAMLANMLFLPIAGKLRNLSDEEAMVKAITVEGVLSLGKQENPIVVEQRLQSFLPLAPAA